jgi:serine/threonine-protein kinase
MEERIVGGKYRLGERVGAGPGYETYKATDDQGVSYALKIMHPPDAATREKLAADLSGLSDLDHPNLARMYASGEDGDDLWLAREWVEGTDLKAMVREHGALDPIKAATYASQAAAALSVAHARGFVSGNVRPDNLLLSLEDQVKLVGFSIPSAAKPAIDESEAEPQVAYYMSPEQAKGGDVTPSSDVYSLGAVLYELVTGSPPFVGESAQEVAVKQTSEQLTAPRQVNAAIPPALEAVVLRAMQKEPAERYGSAEEMRQELDRVVKSAAAAPVAAPPPEEKKQSKAWIWILVVVLILVGLGAAWALGLFGGNIEVPDLTGLTIEQATTALEEEGLVLGESELIPDESGQTAENTIYEQDPAAGERASEGDAIDVVVNGSESSEVPDLVGLTEAEAVTAINDAGLTLDRTEREFNPEVEAGIVYEQTPAAGSEVPMETPVTILVSKGTETAAVPNVVGLQEAQATQALQDAGFQVAREEEFNDSVAAGVVSAQNPSAGVNTETGTTVTITVSKGAETVSVPNVVGQQENQATETLEDAGLRTSVSYEDNANVGVVLRQDPAAGTSVAPDTRVTIVVGQQAATTP